MIASVASRPRHVLLSFPHQGTSYPGWFRAKVRIAAELNSSSNVPTAFRDTLAETLHRSGETRTWLGNRLFRIFLALHFSTSRAAGRGVGPIIGDHRGDRGLQRATAARSPVRSAMLNGMSFLAGSTRC